MRTSTKTPKVEEKHHRIVRNSSLTFLGIIQQLLSQFPFTQDKIGMSVLFSDPPTYGDDGGFLENQC